MAGTSPHASGKSRSNQDAPKVTSPELKVSPGIKRAAAGGNALRGRGGKKAKRNQKQEQDDEEGEKTVKAAGQRPKNSKRRSVASKVSYKEQSNSEEEEVPSDEEEFQANSEDESEDSERETKPSRKSKEGKNVKATQSSGGRKIKEEVEGTDEEVEEITNHRSKRRKMKKMKGPGADEWLEVYLEKTTSWVCVDVEHGVGMPHLCSQNATAPVTYVVSVDGDGFIKDLGKKYDPHWMTSSRKRRVEDEWWDIMLEPFLGPEDERDRKEDKEVRGGDTKPPYFI